MNNTIDTTQTLLVSLETGLPRQSRELKAVASKAEQQAHAQAGTTRASLHYWRWEEGNKKFDGLDTLRSFQNAFRAAITHFARFPFATGAMMLPAALAEPCLKVKEEFQKQFIDVRKKWLNEKYPELAKSAPTRMGSFYSGEDFPTWDECADRIKCEIAMFPLAPAEQVKRIALLSPNIAATIEKSANESYQKGKADAHQEFWSEVMKPIQHCVDVLNKGEKGKIYDSMVGNIISIVDLIPAYNNVFNDPQLTALADEAKKAFAEIKPDDLRQSAEAKAKMLASAQSIVNTFKPYQRKLAV